MAFCLCVCIPAVSLFVRTPVVLDQGLTLMTSFDFNYPHKSPISEYSVTGGRVSYEWRCYMQQFITMSKALRGALPLNPHEYIHM